MLFLTFDIKELAPNSNHSLLKLLFTFKGFFRL